MFGRTPSGVAAFGVVLALAVGALAPLGSAGATGETAQTPSARLLTVQDLPIGWSKTKAVSSDVTDAACLSGIQKLHTDSQEKIAAFVEGTALPSFGEVLFSRLPPSSSWARLNAGLATCKTFTLTISGEKHKVTIHGLDWTFAGALSASYEWSFRDDKIAFNVDLVIFNEGSVVGFTAYSDLGSPSPATAQAFTNAALEKLNGASGQVRDVVSVASTPVRIAHTSMGDVAYRELGRGYPLVLVMGYGAPMEAWDRRFVDALAERYQVVLFDNAGIGGTQGLRAPLSIDEMADQTSALVSALGLKSPDILGWSMGGMIAQALAVLHPAQVHRLVLCATFPGRGPVERPSQKDIDALTNGDTKLAIADLWPADQTSAYIAYVISVTSYPPGATASPATIDSQASAIIQWWSAKDTAGRQASSITSPTLIADGAIDQIDPVVNDHALAGLIPSSRLVIYPDAGHAFLFQEGSRFVSTVESFLG